MPTVLRPLAISVLMFGVFLMHGMSDPASAEHQLPGLTHAMTNSSMEHRIDAGSMTCAADACGHHETMPMAMVACAFAVLAYRPETTTFLRSIAPLRLPRTRCPLGLLRGPEPPVPRFV